MIGNDPNYRPPVPSADAIDFLCAYCGDEATNEDDGAIYYDYPEVGYCDAACEKWAQAQMADDAWEARTYLTVADYDFLTSRRRTPVWPTGFESFLFTDPEWSHISREFGLDEAICRYFDRTGCEGWGMGS